jgi:hypothetical protein
MQRNVLARARGKALADAEVIVFMDHVSELGHAAGSDATPSPLSVFGFGRVVRSIRYDGRIQVLRRRVCRTGSLPSHVQSACFFGLGSKKCQSQFISYPIGLRPIPPPCLGVDSLVDGLMGRWVIFFRTSHNINYKSFRNP